MHLSGAEQLPTSQHTHVEAPTSENVPAAGHSWHVSDNEAPSVGEDVPGEQGVLSKLPPSQKWPTGQVIPDVTVTSILGGRRSQVMLSRARRKRWWRSSVCLGRLAQGAC